VQRHRRPSTKGVPIAIYAQLAQGFAEWVSGVYDGMWRTGDLPAEGGQWFVRDWRPIERPEGQADCRRLARPVLARDQMLRPLA